MGLATQNETQVALNAIRNSSGVKRVINLVQIEDATTQSSGQGLNTPPTVTTVSPTGTTSTTDMLKPIASAPVATAAPVTTAPAIQATSSHD
ncbi:hypothetical protein ABTN30_19865, partial [Acinetobacter baumannii]